MLNYGLGFEYNKNTQEIVVKNRTCRTVYDVEMLFKVYYGICNTKFKRKKIRKIREGETRRIKFREYDIKNIELVNYDLNYIKDHTKLLVLICSSIFLYIASILFLMVNCISTKDIITGTMFLTIFPAAIFIFDLGAKYDHMKEERLRYNRSVVKILPEMEM